MTLTATVRIDPQRAKVRYSRMVFIGRDLNEAQLRAGFETCIAA